MGIFLLKLISLVCMFVAVWAAYNMAYYGTAIIMAYLLGIAVSALEEAA